MSVIELRSEELLGCAVVFEPSDPPRAGTVIFQESDGGVVRLPVGDAVPTLLRATRDRWAPTAHPTVAFWGAATVVALRLVAGGRMLPAVSVYGFDAWRVGPLEPADSARIRELAATVSTTPELLHAFLDAVADSLARTPASEWAAGGPAFAAVEPQRVPEMRGWAAELAAGPTMPVDEPAGFRVSLRVDMTEPSGAHGGQAEEVAFRAVVQLHSLADPARVIEAGALWSAEGGVPVDFGARARIDTVLAVRRIAGVWAPLGRLLEEAVPAQVALADEEVAELLGDAGARLAAMGVEVHWPKSLGRELTATAVVGTADAGTAIAGRQPDPTGVPTFFGGDQLLRFDWQVALRGEPLTEAELELLAETHRPVVRLRDQWMLVDPGLRRKARERVLKPLTAIDALAATLAGTAEVEGERVQVAATGWLEALRARIADPDREGAAVEPVQAPAGLAATLRDYQLRGLRWLVRMTSLGLGCCLADDMGLGKTITLIALHLHRQGEPGPTLVVCPASLLGNWEREITRFAPGTPVRRFHGADRSLAGAEEGFVLTTYGTMRLDADRLGAHQWGLIVADEAQHVKNPTSDTAKALRRVSDSLGPAGARIALTGTPVENSLSELWAILDWTTPGLLGPLGAFRARWSGAGDAGPDSPPGELDRLSRLVRPFLLRRRKSDPGIAPELPPKTETDQLVALTREQAALYEACVRETMARIQASTGMERRGLILALLTSLKQICNHPAQYLKEDPPGRLDARSGKLELLDELLDTILAEDGAVLVFTQYVAMARLLHQHLDKRGVPAQLLHGGTPVRQRDEMVRRFQASPDGAPVFLLSLKAAGTGLNLTRADHVIHYDRWWNPAVEAQATDRAYRIGQTRPVQVHRLIAEGTVEDRIAAMLQAKRALAEAVLSVGEAALTELSDTELADLIELQAGTNASDASRGGTKR
ncbi:DEAD/DEAH box helicase [Actinopolymorpha alba]|uniref:DEAD/DEAH box helicase n=1 Tax=Actinopolymorpha alba TaxID=533267 RepID=UPI00035DB725|nr:DEAD/DEAH box helicase [Actinopolymorpha alba]